MTPGVARRNLPASHRQSFRDPSGQTFLLNGRVLRCVFPAGLADLASALKSPTLAKFRAKGDLVGANRISAPEGRRLSQLFLGGAEALWLEHPPIWFPSYPYEWPAEMLYRAGKLTLEAASDLVEENLGLKDASAYNVLFEGTRPVFIDWLSFEKRNGKAGRWLPFAQFTKHFLLPLALFKFKRQSCPDSFLRQRDGIDELEAFRRCSFWERWFTPLVFLISIPTVLSKLARASHLYEPSDSTDSEKAQFLLGFLLASLKRKLNRLAPREVKPSRWSGYMESSRFHYDADQFRTKEDFVRSTLAGVKAKRVLDVGCNTGHFSLLAARAGARVIAIDSDEATVGKAFRAATEAKADVQTLVVDIARPTPAIGWNNSEFPSFLKRADRAFDVVMMLAVVHHLSIAEGIPLPEIAGLAARMTNGHLIVEFVAPTDPQAQSLVRGRDFSHLSEKAFEDAFGRYFKRVRRQSIPGTERVLYHFARKKHVQAP